jgi:hypothetical protein
MTLPARCPFCGGPIAIKWDTAFCVGFCGLPVDEIETLADEERRAWMRALTS